MIRILIHVRDENDINLIIFDRIYFQFSPGCGRTPEAHGIESGLSSAHQKD